MTIIYLIRLVMNKHFHNLVVHLVCSDLFICICFFKFNSDKKRERWKNRNNERGKGRGRERVLLFGGLTSLRLTEAIGPLLFVFLLPKNSKSS